MILAEKEISFKTLEQKIYEEMCMIGRKILAEILKKIDGRLMAERDRSIYRHKGFQKTALKTIMGEVEIERVKYIYKEESGEESCRYLLDEMIGLNGGVGNISENLVMKIASSCCEMPYRKAAEMISEITGQTISHMGVWQVVQTLGDAVTQKEDEASKLVKKHESVGQVEKKLLFEEQDGVWLSIQGKDRKKHANLQATDIYSTNEANVAGADLPTPSIETSPSDSPDKTQTPLNKTDKPVKKVYAEMKVAIAYSGAKKTGKNRYNLVDKVATAGFEGVVSAHTVRPHIGQITSPKKLLKIFGQRTYT